MRLILTCFLLFVAFNYTAQTRKYFRNAFMDIYGNCFGMYQITEEEAHQMNYYVFEFDTINRLYDVKNCNKEDENGVYSKVLNGIRLTYDFKETGVIIQSYNAGEDLDNLYEPSLFYWEKRMNPNNTTSSIITFEASEEDNEYFEETSKIQFNYDEKSNLLGLYVSGQNPYYFGVGKEKNVVVKLNSKNQVTEEIYEFSIDVDSEETVKMTTEYDENGNIVSQKNYNFEGKIKKIAPFISYFVSDFDINGYLSRIIAFDSEGNKVNGAKVELNSEEFKLPCQINNTYDSRGNLLKISFFDKDLNPFLMYGRVSVIEYTYDSLNNQISQFNYGANKEPVLDENGYSGYRYAYQELGQMSERTFYGENQLPTKNNIGVFKIVYEYDSYGFTSAENYFDEYDQAIEDYSGAHRYEFEYYYDDEGSGKTVTNVFDKSLNSIGIDELVENESDILKYRKVLDENSSVINEIWFDKNNKPIIGPDKFHKVVYEYNSSDMYTLEAYYNEKNELMIVPEMGFAKRTIDIDDSLYLEREIRFYDESEKLMLNIDSVAVIKYTYNKLNLVEETTQLNQFEQPNSLQTGYYKSINKYDELGNSIEVSYYDSKEKLKEDKFGFAIYRFKYDAEYLQEKSFYSKKNKLKSDSKGVAVYVYTYDQNGNMTSETYRNSKNKPCETLDNVARIEMTYFPNGNIKSVEAKNSLNQLVNSKFEGKNCAKIEYVYSSEENDRIIKYYSNNNEIIEEGR